MGQRVAVFTPADKLATRESASKAEAAITKKVWNLFGGSADLNESTFTDVKDGGDFERGHYEGRNLHFGIREHGNGASITERESSCTAASFRMGRVFYASPTIAGPRFGSHA